MSTWLYLWLASSCVALVLSGEWLKEQGAYIRAKLLRAGLLFVGGTIATAPLAMIVAHTLAYLRGDIPDLIPDAWQ